MIFLFIQYPILVQLFLFNLLLVFSLRFTEKHINKYIFLVSTNLVCGLSILGLVLLGLYYAVPLLELLLLLLVLLLLAGINLRKGESS